MNWPLLAEILGFAFGCMIHLGAVAALWVRNTPPELGYADFFKDKRNRATAQWGAAIDLMGLFLWHSGMLPGVLDRIGMSFDFVKMAPEASTFVLAVIVGYACDAVGKRAFMLLEKKAEVDD